MFVAYLMSPGISELLCQSKVDCVNQISFLPESHQKIVRFNVTMNEVLSVNKLDTANLKKHLVI